MLLDSRVDSILARLIGFCNGVLTENLDVNLHDEIIFILKSIRDMHNLDEANNKIVELKKTYLSNCLTCAFPCGRTDDYHINMLQDKMREDKIKAFNKLLTSFEDYDYQFLIEELCRLSF